MSMRIPSATYRVQLNKDFTFKDLHGIVDYLNTLGISTVYAAPVLEATPGSEHGYDVTDPHRINPEIGTQDELKKLSTTLKEKGMTWLQDIVPNHMAFNTANVRLMDVLERGTNSEYHNYFDIDWHHPSPALAGKLMVPFLGRELVNCIESGELKIEFSRHGFTVNYFDAKYPLSVCAYEYLSLFSDIPECEIVLKDLREITAQAEKAKSFREWSRKKSDWINALLNDAIKGDAIQKMLSRINEQKTKIKRLLEHQCYVLTCWKQTEREINYRRFFTVNSLICLRMEDEWNFAEYHSFLHALFKEDLFQGLRIDHIDGLNDPTGYLENLRRLFGDNCYIIAEKILEAREEMPPYWVLQGASGYQFLSHVNQLFTNKEGAKKLLRYYNDLVPDMPSYRKLVYLNKKLMLEKYMGGEWDNLVRYFFDLQLNTDFSATKLKQALGLIMLAMPVYRIYPRQIPLKGKNLKFMQDTFESALHLDSGCREELEFLKTIFTQPPGNSQHGDRILLFLRRLMQFTGPLTAKGVEDTTFYIYNALISHDEVGDAPSTLGISVQEFHSRMEARKRLTPLSLNATATHDTKRGEDGRLRLNVLSEAPELWQEKVTVWFAMNKQFKKNQDGREMPSINDEYFIYQSMVAGCPEDLKITDDWIKRLQTYLVKALREAKVNSNWEQPNEQYEEACMQFIEYILREEHKFLLSFLAFVKKICRHANLYTLGQVLIKLTTPGIPDIYQGCELWDLSYVDPDNRRAVDYRKRKKYLEQVMRKEKEGKNALFSFLATRRNDGMEKLFLTYKVLTFRKAHAELFIHADYISLDVTGAEPWAIAYARHFRDQWALVVIPFNLGRKDEQEASGINIWDNQYVLLPENAPVRWNNVFTNESILAKDHRMSMQEALKIFSVAMFRNSGMDT